MEVAPATSLIGKRTGQSLSGVAAYGLGDLRSLAVTKRSRCECVRLSNLFSVLGRQSRAGRVFRARKMCRPGLCRPAHYGFVGRRFGADPKALGQASCSMATLHRDRCHAGRFPISRRRRSDAALAQCQSGQDARGAFSQVVAALKPDVSVVGACGDGHSPALGRRLSNRI